MERFEYLGIDSEKPIAFVTIGGTIVYNLSCMPASVEAWCDVISHEWVCKLAFVDQGISETEWIVETVVEACGFTSIWAGGVLSNDRGADLETIRKREP